MAVPKRKVSKSRKGKRRSHDFARPKQHTYCDQCGDPILPHYLCAKCGYSNIQRREMVDVETEEK